MAARQLREYLETGNIRNSVNYPNVELPYIGKKRITIMHQNVPNMVGQITGCLAEHHINIADMINRSKHSWAYTMIDIDNGIDDIIKENIVENISKITGVVAVRMICVKERVELGKNPTVSGHSSSRRKKQRKLQLYRMTY